MFARIHYVKRLMCTCIMNDEMQLLLLNVSLCVWVDVLEYLKTEPEQVQKLKTRYS